jgi:hypothetical protein
VAIENPYAPPKSNVVASHGRVEKTKPRQVTYAVWLLWMSILLSIPTSIFEFDRTQQDRPLPETGLIVSFLLIYALEVALVLLISRGRNWARITFLALVALAIVSASRGVFLILSYPVSQLALNAGILATELAAIYLLFTPPGSRWFRDFV